MFSVTMVSTQIMKVAKEREIYAPPTALCIKKKFRLECNKARNGNTCFPNINLIRQHFRLCNVSTNGSYHGVCFPTVIFLKNRPFIIQENI